jgi:hypothetical protein
MEFDNEHGYAKYILQPYQETEGSIRRSKINGNEAR